MGFFKEIRKRMRQEGVWLTADQTKTLVYILQRTTPTTTDELLLTRQLYDRYNEMRFKSA